MVYSATFIKMGLEWELNGGYGGEGGIRTRDTGLPYTAFRERRLQPLGHLSKGCGNVSRSTRHSNPVYQRASGVPMNSRVVVYRLRSE